MKGRLPQLVIADLLGHKPIKLTEARRLEAARERAHGWQRVKSNSNRYSKMSSFFTKKLDINIIFM